MPGIASAATAVVDRPRRRRHVDDPRRRRRHHAAQPRAAGDRRAVRHARRRSTPGASTSASAARPGTDQRTARALRRTLAGDADASPRTSSSCWRYFRPPEPGQRVRAVPGAGARRADLDPGLEPVRRPARGRARPAVRLRLALRAGAADAGARRLPRALQALGSSSTGPTSCSASTSSRPTPTTRRGACSPRCSRRSSTCAAAGPTRCRRRVRGYARAPRPPGTPRCSTASRLRGRRRARDGARAARGVRRPHRRRRADAHLADLRPPRPAALVRDRRWALAKLRERRPAKRQQF